VQIRRHFHAWCPVKILAILRSDVDKRIDRSCFLMQTTIEEETGVKTQNWRNQSGWLGWQLAYLLLYDFIGSMPRAYNY
jgi:hypothetical protein